MSRYSLFEKAFIVALDKRKEHWEDLLQQAKTLGIDCEAFVCGSGADPDLTYDLIDEVNPDVSQWGYGVPHLKHHHYNCLLAHKEIIRRAKTQGLKNILMLEDDSVFIESRFTEAMGIAQERIFQYNFHRDYDLIYLGYWYGDESSQFNTKVEHFWKTEKDICLHEITPGNNLGGWHGVVVNERAYDLLLNAPMNNPLDTFCCFQRHRLKSALFCPKVIHVKSMYSETEGAFFERKKYE